MKKLQIIIIVFLISLSICAFAGMQVKACDWITVTQTANGWITPGTTAFEFGDTPSFTIIPDAGYHIASITANGEPVTVTSPLGQSYQFSALSDDGSLTATFAINMYSFSVTQTADGQITPGTTTVDYGGLIAFYINPDSGYYIASITVDAGSVVVTSPSGQTVTFNNVQAAHTITATYAQTSTPTPTPTPLPLTSSPTSTASSSSNTTPSPTPTVSASAFQSVIIGIAVLIAVTAAILVYTKKPKKMNQQ
jgi:hypothetical protein